MGDLEGILNLIVSECSKLAQKEYRTRHDWVEKMIHRELYKRFKFGYADKSYMHKPDSFQENNMQKVIWDFEMQTDAVPVDNKVKIKES